MYKSPVPPLVAIGPSLNFDHGEFHRWWEFVLIVADGLTEVAIGTSTLRYARLPQWRARRCVGRIEDVTEGGILVLLRCSFWADVDALGFSYNVLKCSCDYASPSYKIS